METDDPPRYLCYSNIHTALIVVYFITILCLPSCKTFCYLRRIFRVLILEANNSSSFRFYVNVIFIQYYLKCINDIFNIFLKTVFCMKEDHRIKCYKDVYRPLLFYSFFISLPVCKSASGDLNY